MTLIGCFGAAASTQSPSSENPGVGSIQGTVRNAKGEAVEDASVFLEDTGHSQLAKTKTQTNGVFAFTALGLGAYSLRAERAGVRSAAVSVTLSKAEGKRVDLVLGNFSPSPNSLEFADKPDFTVAGVTDGSNLGGHGSDANVRTSEALARDTAGLKSGASTRSAIATSPEEREAENELRASLVKTPADFEANRKLAEFYLRAHRYAQAQPLLQAAYQIDPANYANAYDLAVALQFNGEFARARDQAQRLLAREERSELHRLLGDLDEQLGDPLAAVHEYEVATRLEPSEQNYFDWATELLLHKAVRPAVEVFTTGVGAYPRSPRMRAGLGAAFYADGEYADAARCLCEASDLNPEDAAPYILIGKMEKAAPDPLPCAEEKLARFAQAQPADALGNYYYALALWKRVKASNSPSVSAQVLLLLEKAVSANPRLDEAYVQLGVVHAARGESALAIGSYKKAIAANPQSGEAHYRLGLAYKRLSEDAKAQRELQLYKEIEQAETAEVERQRRDLRQFMIILKDQSPGTAPH